MTGLEPATFGVISLIYIFEIYKKIEKYGTSKYIKSMAVNHNWGKAGTDDRASSSPCIDTHN